MCDLWIKRDLNILPFMSSHCIKVNPNRHDVTLIPSFSRVIGRVKVEHLAFVQKKLEDEIFLDFKLLAYFYSY